MNDQKIIQAREYVNNRYGALPAHQRCYLVLMSPRSGSTLLCKHLEKIGYGRPVEAFHFNHESLRRKHGWQIDSADPFSHFEQALDHQTVNGICGMKMSWVEFEIFLEKASTLIEGSSITLNDAELVDVFFPNAAYIHLKRRDKVKQAVSYAKAMQDGIWSVPTDQDDEYKKYLLPGVYDREHIEGCLDNLLAYDNAWENYLSLHKLDHYSVWYEDLASNYAKVMAEIYAYLEIENKEIINPPLKRLANRISAQWVDRFKSETGWLEDETIKNTLQSGDHHTAFIQRTMMLTRAKERARWANMPVNRFKGIRRFYFRIKRKLLSILKGES